MNGLMRLSLVKELFAGFIRTRGMRRHFHRFALLDALLRTGVTRDVPTSLADTLLKAAYADTGTVLQKVGSNMHGLTEAQAEAVRDEVGPNVIEHEKPPAWWVHLWHCYRNPFNLLLTVLAGISYYTGDMKATVVIGAMVALSTLIRFVQESRSNKAADKLKEMVSNTATVLRRDPAEAAAEEARRYFNVELRSRAPRPVE